MCFIRTAHVIYESELAYQLILLWRIDLDLFILANNYQRNVPNTLIFNITLNINNN